MKVKSESEVAQSCPTLRDPIACSPPGSPVHGIFQARVLEWGAIAFSIALTRRTLFSHDLLDKYAEHPHMVMIPKHVAQKFSSVRSSEKKSTP